MKPKSLHMLPADTQKPNSQVASKALDISAAAYDLRLTW